MVDRLKKTALALNQEAAKIILDRFGIKNVALDNLEQLYNPLNSGLPSMQETRRHLIQRGMTEELADTIAKRYITRCEQGGHVCSIMDLFNSSSNASASINALMKTESLKDIHFAY